MNGSTDAITALQESSARYYQRPGADYISYDTTRQALSGFGGKFNIGKGSKGFWKYNTGVSWLSPGLELNDLGYMNEADEIRQESEVNYFVNKPVSIFTSSVQTLSPNGNTAWALSFILYGRATEQEGTACPKPPWVNLTNRCGSSFQITSSLSN